ncbi:MAG: LUD domain-containing protein [Planctomycetota bacterium]|jgi:L-lactate dehydrogenase complex protein LldG
MADPRPDLVSVFERALVRAGGRLVRVPDEAAAREWVAAADGEPGVDEADLLIAETGTVVRSYPTREDSRVSLVPEVSVFLATPERVVPGLAEALARLALLHREGTAYTVFITGPSRTADIEKEPVVPAHGPRDLVVVLEESG